ncbi:hypothetical protein Gasu2_25280 [Galdieria sulphuraria]|uniref:Uncharacterized protein n=1 Tax=Galdieria sulphuraria TaxID=130081 RepID=M2Y4R6_GALSU|nr:uncharacterized protein Gasu_18500 [Galdieria sulphuraria]EME30834.1 hypothetical protein Gasu_18500 [Galdieria sulphuraria]GJD08225.1 hypothetical protein Gasu2_25280 [Galdieria sulphuraria]|eukprot:XP_005707354.1 hypothetical protein Gasu_18500 [Galdieria sulphuraria]
MTDSKNHSYWKLFKHIVLKGFQGGALLGLASAPYIAYHHVDSFSFSSGQDLSATLNVAWKITQETSWKAATWGLAGGALSGAIGVAKLSIMDPLDVQGRVEALSESKGQLEMDRFAKYSAIAGGTLFALKYLVSTLSNIQGVSDNTWSFDDVNKDIFNMTSSLLGAVVYGAALGTAAGVASHLIFKPEYRPRINKMLTNLFY